MSTAAFVSQPPSPPQSTDGEMGKSDSKKLLVNIEPYTPLCAVRTAHSIDVGLVSFSAGNHEDQARVERDLQAQGHYGDPSVSQAASTQPYYPMQFMEPIQPTLMRTMQYHTPPMAFGDPGVQTRSGGALGSPLSPSSASSSPYLRSSPRVKRASKNAKASKTKSHVIDQPLSSLTADYKIPVKDMHAWVHRPVSVRMKEVEKKKGYISRPMNSFMLYRSAFADRVKQYCKENNHQVVSQVTGASWPLEPKGIREMYEQYAMIERDNHAAAHPNYKFAPNKNGKKRAQMDENASDDDPDWEGSVRSAKRSRISRRGRSRSQSSTPFEPETIPRQCVPPYAPPYAPQYHPSSYQVMNPLGPPPMMVGADDLTGQYYQMTVTPYGQQVDDVKFGRVANPFPQYDLPGSLVGLPNGPHYDLLATDPQVHRDMLDPRLAPFDTNLQYPQLEAVDIGYEMPPNYDYGSYAVHAGITYPQNGSYHPGMATLTDGREAWIDGEQVGVAFDEEFQRWT